MTVYIVAYDVTSSTNRSAVEKWIEAHKTRQKKLQLSMYLLDSTLTASDVRDRLKSMIDRSEKTTDRLWVSEYADPSAWYNAIDPGVKKWLQEHGHP